MAECIFDKIVNGELPSYKVYEDEEHLAFLTIHPINPGHTLVIPKKHISYLFDMEDEDLTKLMLVSKKVANILKKAFNPRTGKIGVMVAGGEVPHVHIHLVPMDSETDLTFERQKFDVTPEEFTQVLEKIKALS